MLITSACELSFRLVLAYSDLRRGRNGHDPAEVIGTRFETRRANTYLCGPASAL